MDTYKMCLLDFKAACLLRAKPTLQKDINQESSFNATGKRHVISDNTSRQGHDLPEIQWEGDKCKILSSLHSITWGFDLPHSPSLLSKSHEWHVPHTDVSEGHLS